MRYAWCYLTVVREDNIAAAFAYEETERIQLFRVNMAASHFTAYIFDEDHRKLNREAALGTEKSGSLFGQWTSTGNPVVHYAVPSNVDKTTSAGIGEELWRRYRLCHIGEWRSVMSYTGQTDYDRNLLRLKFDGGNPLRFLILDVEASKICPYLFESKTPKGRGKLETLQGQNPFNRPDVDPRKTARQHFHPPEQPTATQGWEGWSQSQPSHQPHEAVTRKNQWYSAPEGNKKLKAVVEEFEKIAQDEVKMSRDTTTENISMSFTDWHQRKKWQVSFPPTFPTRGAVLVENPDAPGGGIAYKQDANSTVNQAVGKIISIIGSSRQVSREIARFNRN